MMQTPLLPSNRLLQSCTGMLPANISLLPNADKKTNMYSRSLEHYAVFRQRAAGGTACNITVRPEAPVPSAQRAQGVITDAES